MNRSKLSIQYIFCAIQSEALLLERKEVIVITGYTTTYEMEEEL